jgi:hypothetical protein
VSPRTDRVHQTACPSRHSIYIIRPLHNLRRAGMVGACRCGSSSVKCLKRPSCRSRGRHCAAPVFAVITPDLPTVWEHPHAGVAGSTAPGTGTESAQLRQLVASLERLRPSAVDALHRGRGHGGQPGDQSLRREVRDPRQLWAPDDGHDHAAAVGARSLTARECGWGRWRPSPRPPRRTRPAV